MTHEMKLREAPFVAMRDGKKDIELRLYDEKRSKLCLGDYIIFTCSEREERVCVIIKGLHRYPDFQALFADLPKKRLGYDEEEAASPDDLLAYYTAEDIKRYGVLGIEIALQREPHAVVDIYSKGDYPADLLSNFAPHAFVLDGVACASMEGFLQALKHKSPEKQREICSLTGKAAKMAGKGKHLFKLTGHLYWQGKKLHRRRKEYNALVRRAYEAMLAASEDFKLALLCTQDRPLTHSLGKHSRFTTILTETEFIEHLNAVRRLLHREQ